MPGSWSGWNWLRLPSRVALLLGLGAAAAAGARADAPELPPDTAIGSPAGDVVLRAEGGRIYIAERGGEFRELQFADTAATHRLKQLLDERGAAGVTLDTMRLAGAGGSGFHWTPVGKTDAPASGVDARQPDTPAKTGGAVTPFRPDPMPAPSGSTTAKRADKG